MNPQNPHNHNDDILGLSDLANLERDFAKWLQDHKIKIKNSYQYENYLKIFLRTRELLGKDFH